MSGYFKDSKHRQGLDLTQKLVIGASFFCFVIAAFGAFVMLGSHELDATSKDKTAAASDPTAEKITVLIPVQPINPSMALEPLMFRTEERLRSQVPHKVITSFEQLNGLYAKTLILPNQLLHAEYTTASKPINVVTSKIPEGFRGVTIRVDERSGIEGWARPGSRVDVTWISKVQGKPALTVIVQNSLVISAGRNVNGDYPADMPAPEEMTLLVTKEDARRIILGQQTGILSLSLRGMFESGKTDGSTTITTDDLLGNRGAIVPKPKSVRIIVVGVQNDFGKYEYFNWENNQLVPTMSTGTFF